ncbi:MAG: protein-tyrosine-phosphatase [Planctomycetota bacterium]
MMLIVAIAAVFALLIALPGLADVQQTSQENHHGCHTRFHPGLHAYLTARVSEFGDIPAERKAKLEALASYIRTAQEGDGTARLNFVCTHNSRRSHLSQLWAAAAAAYYELQNIESFSGGSESTAFNPQAVATLPRNGWKILKTTTTSNPIYLSSFAENREAVVGFSKKFDTAPNPLENFAAIMVCSDADQACPHVPGVTQRFAITYADPKAYDGTDHAADAYDERSRQIAREMLYTMSKA